MSLKNFFAVSASSTFLLSLFFFPTIVSAFSGSGAGTLGDPYQITTCIQLQEMNDAKGAHYKLVNNIDCSDTVNWNSGAGFLNIGNGFSLAASFSGSFNGNGKVISNLFINRPSSDLMGLFGISYGGHIYDVGLEDVNITGATYTGGLIGHLYYNSGANLRGTIERVYVTGAVSGTTRVGGIVGEQSLGDVTNSYSKANITGRSGSWIGGVAGVTTHDTAINSRLATKGISNSYATGNITTGSFNIRGGFSGGDSVLVTNSFAVGSVTTGGSEGGGFHGRSNSSSVVSGLYWYNHAGNPSNCLGTLLSGSFPCTTVNDLNHFKNSSNAPLASWDFESVWTVDGVNNDGFPYLQWQQFVPPDITAPVISNIQTSSITNTDATITWTTDEDASTKVVYGLISSANSAVTSETDISPRVTSHSKSIANLLPCTTYQYAVVSGDTSSNYATSTDASFNTTGCGYEAVLTQATSTNIYSGNTGSTNIIENGKTFRVTANAPISTSIVIQVKSLPSLSVLTTLGRPASAPNEVGSTVFDVKAIMNADTIFNSFDTEVTIEYAYSEDEVSSIDESSLWLYHYTGGAWAALNNCILDTGANTISCTTPSFSIFGIFGNPTPTLAQSSLTLTSGASIKSRVTKLLAMGNTTEANTLKAQWYWLFPESKNYNFPVRNLFFGSNGDDVRALQELLITIGKKIPAGPTGFFGSQTRAALADYQKDNSINPAVGYFGQLTRAKMKIDNLPGLWW